MKLYDWKNQFTINNINKLYLSNKKMSLIFNTSDTIDPSDDKITRIVLIKKINISEKQEDDILNENDFTNNMVINYDLNLDSDRVKPYFNILEKMILERNEHIIKSKMNNNISLLLNLLKYNNTMFEKYVKDKLIVLNNKLLISIISKTVSYDNIQFLINNGAKLYDLYNGIPIIFLFVNKSTNYTSTDIINILSNETIETIFIQDKFNRNILNYAISNNKSKDILLEIIKKMLKYQEIIKNTDNKYYMSILLTFLTAISHNNVDILELLFDNFKFIDVNTKYKNKTLLIFSILHKPNVDTIIYLLNLGINKDFIDDNNKTAKNYAEENNLSSDIIKLL